MSENKRSFFSTIPGLVTGLAGLVTGIVGLVTVLIQLGVLGGDDSNGSAVATNGSTTTAPVGAGASVTVAGGTATTEAGTFTVSPTTLNFGPADLKEKPLTVRNTSSTARLSVQTPRVTGKDAARFTATVGDCTSALAPNLTCNIRVTFTPAGPLGNYEANLQIQAAGAPAGAEVKLTASTLLS